MCGWCAVVGRSSSQVTVAEFQDHSGKAVALNRGFDLARNNIVIFADTRQTWDLGTLPNLMKNFADPCVGAVSGELLLRESDGALAGVGQYWRLEKWMRKQESLLHSCVGVTGAVCAVRRVLYQPVPAGTILDDVYWPMKVVMAGYRVIHDARARIYDRLPTRRRDEYLRKIRTLSGNFQLIWRLPRLLVPWRNPIWFAFASHKLTRLFVPWALIGVFASSSLLAESNTIYRWLFVVQVLGYLIAIVGLCSEWASRSKVVAAASAFVLLNGACLVAMFVWISGGIRSNWYRVQYDPDGHEVEQSR